MEHMTRRQDFIAAAKAVSIATPGLILQMRRRADSAAPRVGFTCSKKIGNAVVRNRAKRRLREAVRMELFSRAEPGCDYVLIGRMTTAHRPFTDLRNDLATALNRMALSVCRAGTEG